MPSLMPLFFPQTKLLSLLSPSVPPGSVWLCQAGSLVSHQAGQAGVS